MVFGHETTSHDLNLTANNFIYAGCVQPRGDRAGIAFMCPGGNQPTGTVADNNFATCDGVPAMSDQIPNCSSQMVKTNNRIDDGVVFAEEPQISFNPPAPESALVRDLVIAASCGCGMLRAPRDTFQNYCSHETFVCVSACMKVSVSIPTLASCVSPNVTLRYTTDGSRPTEDSPEVPTDGVPLTWPGDSIAFNVKAFPQPGSDILPSVTNGANASLFSCGGNRL